MSTEQTLCTKTQKYEFRAIVLILNIGTKIDGPKNKMRRPFLVYSGELQLKAEDQDFFDALVNVEDWLVG